MKNYALHEKEKVHNKELEQNLLRLKMEARNVLEVITKFKTVTLIHVNLNVQIHLGLEIKNVMLVITMPSVILMEKTVMILQLIVGKVMV